MLFRSVDSSGEYERGTKLPLYARAGIREVWIVDVVHYTIEVYRRPALRTYRDRRELSRRQTLSPAAFPRTTFRVSEIVGRPLTSLAASARSR